jgi:hypothetical protein
MAIITDQNTSIYEKDKWVTNYSLPISSEKVVSASFSPSNSLLIASDANKAYVLTSQPCP